MSFLKVDEVYKSFGGLKAINNVSFAMGKNIIKSIIGPNGAGKSTLFNLISGHHKADRGKIIFKDSEIHKFSPYKIAYLGISRTFQTIKLFPKMTVKENIMAARHTKSKAGLISSMFRLPSSNKEEKQIKERDRLRLLLLNKLIEENEFELPEILVKSETENQMHSLEHFLQDQNLSFDDYLKKIKKTTKDLEDEVRKEAEKTLKGFIILRTIASLENIVPNDNEIEKAMNDILNQQVQRGEDINQIDKESLKEYIKERLTSEKVFQYLENLVKDSEENNNNENKKEIPKNKK